MQRIKEYGDPHGVRFRKKIDRELAAFCAREEVQPSTVIQTAVECFLLNKDCKARYKI